jgi:hypothetical protein
MPTRRTPWTRSDKLVLAGFVGVYVMLIGMLVFKEWQHALGLSSIALMMIVALYILRLDRRDVHEHE